MVIFFPKKSSHQTFAKSVQQTSCYELGAKVNAVCVTADKKKSDGRRSAVPGLVVGNTRLLSNTLQFRFWFVLENS